ncbi:MAG TPA: hypothetical protein VEA41_06700 [Salinarimonas sp.]|nr:hypothetical protein [Salinarimonas sp.]
MSLTIGLDPGKDGALVALDGMTVLAQVLTADLLLEKQYVPERLAEEVRRVLLLGDPSSALVVLETPMVLPGEAGRAGLTTGKGWGLWRGIFAALGIAVIEPAPSAWTRAMLRDAPGEGKARAVHVASSRLPGLNLTPGRRRKPHEGLADAAVLALYGQTRR